MKALAAFVPRSGTRYSWDGPWFKSVVIRRSRWSYRIAYGFHGGLLFVDAIIDGWLAP